MLGAIYGDICGCAMEEGNAAGNDTTTTKGLRGYSEITELTLAVAQWLMDDPKHTQTGLEQCIRMMDKPEGNIRFSKETIKNIPAAACVSPVGLYASTEEEVTRLADIVAETIGCEEAWKSEIVAECVFINRNEGRKGLEKTRELMQWLMKSRPTGHTAPSGEEMRQQSAYDCLQVATTAYQTRDSLKECALHATHKGGNTAAAIACSLMAACKDVREREPGNHLLRMIPPILRAVMLRFESKVFPTAPTLHCFKVAENIYAGEYPFPKDDDGDTTELSLKGFRHFGITHFIDLTEKGEMKPYKGMLYDGMTHLRFPIRKKSIPGSTKEVWDILKMIDRILETNPSNKVYLHCSDGIGRTGMVAGCLIAEKTGGTVEDTLRRLRSLFNDSPKSVFSTIPMTEEQLMFIQKYVFWRIVRPPMSKPDGTHQAIDLGLPSGTRWANCNVGATKPEESGEFFTWEDRNEVAHTFHGNDWRLPSLKDIKELLGHCFHEWTTVNGVEGRLFTSIANGNSIFLPAAGNRYDCTTYYKNSRGYYWTDTPCKDNIHMAHALFFFEGNAYESNCYLDRWLSVRLVIN